MDRHSASIIQGSKHYIIIICWVIIFLSLTKHQQWHQPASIQTYIVVEHKSKLHNGNLK